MLTLARASELLNRMPNKLLVKDISKRECEELWEFVNTTDKLSISQHRLKTAINLHHDHGCYDEQPDNV